MNEYETKYLQEGYKAICGIDEVGRGPLIGPVVASAVILPEGYQLEGLTDSKKVSEKKRELLFDIIKKDAIAIGIGIIPAKRIDEINILNATKEAMMEAVKQLSVTPDILLIDGNMKFNINYKYESIVKGDSKSISIAAASIIAKVTRDRMLIELDKKHPEYNFKKNKGYPTREHFEAIKNHGILPNHRRSYKPVQDAINNM